jgi:hypothetical protein
MIYAVELEMQSDPNDTVSESVRNAPVSAFGSIDNFNIVPGRAYVGYIQRDHTFFWHEVCPSESHIVGRTISNTGLRK